MGRLGYKKKGKTPVAYLFEVALAAAPESLHPELINNTIALVTGAPATLTDTGNKWLLKGFKAGDRIEISGSTADDGQYTIASVVAGTITLITGDTLTGELAAANTLTITKLGRVFCRDLTIQCPETNTSPKLAVGRTTDIDLATNFGFIVSKLNTFSYEGVYLDEIYVDVGTDADEVFVEYSPVL